MTNAPSAASAPTAAPAAPAALFREMAELSGAQVHVVGLAGELAELIGRLAGDSVIVWPERSGANGAGADRGLTDRDANLDDAWHDSFGVVEARAAVAETGSVVLVESDRSQMLHSLLSKELLVLVRAETIVAQLSELADILNSAAQAKPPQHITLLTGPSRTGDIELHHVNGIQGPFEVHVVVCGFEFDLGDLSALCA